MKRVTINKLLEDDNMLSLFCRDMQNGAVAVVPTDTLYGFAVAADNKNAVNKVYEIKHRDAKKPLILFLTKQSELSEMGFELSKEALKATEKFWPGALTAIFKTVSNPALTAFTFPTMGVRIPEHAALIQLMEKIPFKLLTTSANRSGAASDIDPSNIEKEFQNEIDWLIDGGILTESLPSTVVDFSVSPYKILRQGKICL